LLQDECLTIFYLSPTQNPYLIPHGIKASSCVNRRDATPGRAGRAIGSGRVKHAGKGEGGAEHAAQRGRPRGRGRERSGRGVGEASRAARWSSGCAVIGWQAAGLRRGPRHPSRTRSSQSRIRVGPAGWSGPTAGGPPSGDAARARARIKRLPAREAPAGSGPTRTRPTRTRLTRTSKGLSWPGPPGLNTRL
jgi:hypothetical protein